MSEPLDSTQYLATVVASRTQLTDRIVLFDLMDVDGWRLPPFEAGAHVDVYLQSGTMRQYSICSDPVVQNRYQIAVLRNDDGRGGSKEITALTEGCEVLLSLPRNLFALDVSASKSVLFAAGIGITPMMSMIPVLKRNNTDFVLYLCTRTPEDTPFLDEVRALVAEGKAVLHHTHGEVGKRLNLGEVIGDQSTGTHFYACGPSGFIDDYVAATAHLNAAFVHYERFSVPVDEFQAAYRLKLAKSEITVEVGKGETMVEALRRCDVKILTGCLAGICGACRIPYLSGDVIHRDMKLNSLERREALLSCVAGCASDELVLDL